MKTWKVWVEIEECDDEADTFQTVDVLDFSATAEFDSLEKAVAFAEELNKQTASF